MVDLAEINEIRKENAELHTMLRHFEKMNDEYEERIQELEAIISRMSKLAFSWRQENGIKK